MKLKKAVILIITLTIIMLMAQMAAAETQTYLTKIEVLTNTFPQLGVKVNDVYNESKTDDIIGIWFEDSEIISNENVLLILKGYLTEDENSIIKSTREIINIANLADGENIILLENNKAGFTASVNITVARNEVTPTPSNTVTETPSNTPTVTPSNIETITPIESVDTVEPTSEEIQVLAANMNAANVVELPQTGEQSGVICILLGLVLITSGGIIFKFNTAKK